MENIELFEKEHIEYLSDDVGVIVSSNHTFGTDAILLASFACPKIKDKACDLGTGCGIIPFLWLRDGLCSSISAVELQKDAANQVERSIDLNSNSNLQIYNYNLKNLKGVLPFGGYDLVTINPPYKKAQSGIESTENSAKIARHEVECTLEDIAKISSKLLKFGGKLCMCNRPERLFETLNEMHKAKVEPKRLRLVHKNSFSAPWLFLVEGRRGGKNGMTVMPPLFIENSDGGYSDEMLSILGKYREGAIK